MKIDLLKTKVEAFVCNHEDCKLKGSKELTDELKKWAKQEHAGNIKVYRSGCLGKCEEGIAVAIYPDKTILTEVAKSDSNEIKNRLIKAVNDLN